MARSVSNTVREVLMERTSVFIERAVDHVRELFFRRTFQQILARPVIDHDGIVHGKAQDRQKGRDERDADFNAGKMAEDRETPTVIKISCTRATTAPAPYFQDSTGRETLRNAQAI